MDAWDINQVTAWISSLGLKRHEKIFRDNNITGDILIHADHDMLKELEITAVGQRIALLKAIYNIKVQNGIPFEEDDYIPETVASANSILTDQGLPILNQPLPPIHNDIAHLEVTVSEQALTIERLNTEVACLSIELQALKNDLCPVWALLSEYRMFQQKTDSRYEQHMTDRSPAVTDFKQSKASVVNLETNMPNNGALCSITTGKMSLLNPVVHSPISVSVMGNELFDDANMLKHSSVSITTTHEQTKESDGSTIKIYGHYLFNRDLEAYKSFCVQYTDDCAKLIPDVLLKYKVQEDWKLYALFIQFRGKERCLSYNECPLQLIHQMQDNNDIPEFFIRHIKKVKPPTSRPRSIDLNTISPKLYIGARSENMDALGLVRTTDLSVNNKRLPIGYAINEYTASTNDEFDVKIGETFQIITKEHEWTVGERDGKRGWIPSDCLFIISGSSYNSGDAAMLNQHGVALYDYEKTSLNELSISQGDVLNAICAYQHWLLVEFHDKQGWVPICYISAFDKAVAILTRKNPKVFNSLHSTPLLSGSRVQSEPLTTHSQSVGKHLSQTGAVKYTISEPTLSIPEHTMSTPKSAPPKTINTKITVNSTSTKDEPLAQGRSLSACEGVTTNRNSGLSARIHGGARTADMRVTPPRLNVMNTSALSKLTSLLDTINPFLDDFGANANFSDPKFASVDSVNLAILPSLKPFSEDEQTFSSVSGKQNGTMESTHRQASLEELTNLSQSLSTASNMILKYHCEASTSAMQYLSSQVNLDRFKAAEEMLSVLGEKLGIHGTHTMSAAAYACIIIKLDDLDKNIHQRLLDLQAYLLSNNDLTHPDSQDSETRQSDSMVHIKMIQETIDFTHSTLTSIVELLLEDARIYQRIAQSTSMQDNVNRSALVVTDKVGTGSSEFPDIEYPVPTSQTHVNAKPSLVELRCKPSSDIMSIAKPTECFTHSSTDSQEANPPMYIARKSMMNEREGKLASGVSTSQGIKRAVQSNIDLGDVITPEVVSTSVGGVDMDGNASQSSTPRMEKRFQGSNMTDTNVVDLLGEGLPYSIVLQRKDLDQNNLEKYLCNEDCIKYLGFAKADLAKLPSWKLDHLKRRAKMIT
ncbi:hypothetical protein O5D80_000190 [Batrachochytrium dendrobatidis]|nr:hypothetical protein O5D80_000190 [Batrachochytrium dendrobatidis]